MPRVTAVDRELSTLEYHNFFRPFYEAKTTEDWHMPVENKSDSFGLLNGRLVAVDYGN